MSLNLPTIEELVEQSLIELKDKEDNLLKAKKFLKDKSPQVKYLILKSYEEEIEELKNTLDKHKELVRDIKLKQILK